MSPSVCSSDSLIGSLCREAATIRAHTGQICTATAHCQDPQLLNRLERERRRLQRRRDELKTIAHQLRQQRGIDRLALDFLIELCSRPMLPS